MGRKGRRSSSNPIMRMVCIPLSIAILSLSPPGRHQHSESFDVIGQIAQSDFRSCPHDPDRPHHQRRRPHDLRSKDVLCHWFGYVISGMTRLQKILLLYGPSRAGKGTIARILTALAGPRNCCAPTLGSLAGPFGLQPLIGMSLAIVGDARLSGRSDSAVIVERLLSISGEDAVTIDRKCMKSISMRLATRFTLMTNELPRLADAAGVFSSRLVLLRLT